MDMSASEQSMWHAHVQTPVIFNHHAPLEFDSDTIEKIDLNKIKSTKEAAAKEERVLILTPMRDAGAHIQKYFDLLMELSYPHHLIDLGFLVGDSSDDTMAILSDELVRVQKGLGNVPFHSVRIVQKDFGTDYAQDVQERHSYKAQAPRRKLMAKARNFLLSSTLKPEHSWVYWRDVDIVDSPAKIIEDLIAHDRDIIVPSKYQCRQCASQC
jgi:Anp1